MVLAWFRLCFRYGFVMVCDGCVMALLWLCHAFASVSYWFCYCLGMVLFWVCHGFDIGLSLFFMVL